MKPLSYTNRIAIAKKVVTKKFAAARLNKSNAVEAIASMLLRADSAFDLLANQQIIREFIPFSDEQADKLNRPPGLKSLVGVAYFDQGVPKIAICELKRDGTIKGKPSGALIGYIKLDPTAFYK